MAQAWDVAIVGAGIAGLSAAQTLRSADVNVIVLEAAPRIGGRAFTDTTSFAQPWDLGCHWLHSARLNPFTAIADTLGFRYATAPTRLVRRLLLDEGWADPDQVREADAAVEATFAAVSAAGEEGRDVPAADVLPAAGRWRALTRHWLELMTASPPERISTRDFAAYDGTDDNWPVLDGYGALVAAHFSDIPVTLGCPVTRIDRSGRLLALETPRGTVAAHKVIVTVPLAVVARGGLAFVPALPDPLRQAIEGMTLGIAEKVAFGFSRDVFGFEARTGVTTCLTGARPVNFQVLPGPQPLAIGHVAGDAAAELLAAGEGAMAAAMREALVSAFGADILRVLSKEVATSWARDPYIGGGYSNALPGCAHLRARLHEPVDGRIFFAGEAVRDHDFSTAHGALRSGRAAADRIIQSAPGPAVAGRAPA